MTRRRRVAGLRARGERGSATVELAVVLPAVVALLVVVLAALQLAATRVRLADAAADSARSLARGEGAAHAAAVAARHVPGASVRGGASGGGMQCVEVVVAAPVLGLRTVPLSARGCALEAGR
ncbi:TadE family type IV pilus minor pilin [Homoserinibacter sp. YIM 151385]|uniref:TadE family type IV pilus minor pilin n=1 Tax=Homoserinibacter sp. YIM 151385 TaxID=2985506 RepID=UPI0022F05385|nr:TadE family type IV pilus minor pilin [Homoserinibacter sp. YIM 151385]WBU36865.1 TadE family type IV pilus minor pilin [Homoserinibacter sp. YIM 151385]